MNTTQLCQAGKCEATCDIIQCGENEICNDFKNDCECAPGWTGKPGSCKPTCDVIKCGENEVCSSESISCVCQNGFQRKNGVCTPKMEEKKFTSNCGADSDRL